MPDTKRQVHFNRLTRRRVRVEIIAAQLERIIRIGLGKTYAAKGWIGRSGKVRISSKPDGHLYQAALFFTKRSQRTLPEASIQQQWADICRKLSSAGRTLGWLPNKPEEDAATTAPTSVSHAPRFSMITQNWQRCFQHLYDRDSQVRIMIAAVEAAYQTDFRDRCHCVLWGLPGCGKTVALRAMAALLGSDACCQLDATSLTKAGAERLLLELERIPPVLILEEPEKADPANLSWLLGVLDDRGEIVKTNARIGCVRREARCLVFAAVNNIQIFRDRFDGALASRFPHQIYFPRPRRDVLERILLDKARQSGINEACVPPVLAYCLDEEGNNDPRRLISVLQTGRDLLLTGEFQNDLRAIHSAEQIDTHL